MPVKEIRCISWEDLCEWLEEQPEILEQVRQYITAIRSFLPKSKKIQPDCGLVRDVLEMFRHEMGQGIAKRYGLEELHHSYKSYQDWQNQGLSPFYLSC